MLRSRLKQGNSETCFLVCFLFCCFTFESEEMISSLHFPSAQECGYLGAEATMKDGMQTAFKSCVSLFPCSILLKE